MSNTTNNMNVSTQVPNPVSKPVDHKTLEGSTPGDFRANPGDVAAASLATAADNGGPRNQVGQFDAPPSVTSKLHGSGSTESQGTGTEGA